jgi:uncharacterized protein DUF3300
MSRKELLSGLSLVLALVLFIASSKALSEFGSLLAADGNNTGAPTKAAPKSESELRALVAPIALYPDNLVGEVLAGSTFPDQIAVANYWIQQHKDLKGNALVQAVDKQSWNESVKALTQFPQVLNNMAKSLTWTSQLGEAYHNQRSEVMAAIQTLRKQAKDAGHLKSTSQLKVEQQNPQTIVIEPANPDVVYVPEYNPAVIYGVPYSTPGYTGADVAAASALSFGAGIALGSLASGGWGWNSWGTNWSGGTVNFNHNAFVGNTAWHGGYVGGVHPYHYDGSYHPYGDYHPNASRDLNRSELNRDLNRANLNHFSDANSWAHHDNWAAKSTAFSGLHSHPGGFGGWSSRADSARGWGSMHAGGFGGFHGGFHGFGGFHGGGFHGRR